MATRRAGSIGALASVSNASVSSASPARMAVASPNFLWQVGFAAAQVIVVERRQIVMNERVGVNKFERAGDRQDGSHIGGKNSRRFEAQNRPDAFSAGLHAVAHGAVDRGRLRVFAGHQPVEGGVHRGPVFFEKCGKVHQVEGGSGARSRRGRLGIFLGFGIEGFRRHFAAGFLEQNFHFALGLLQIFLAIARELHAFFEQLHGFVERKIRAFQFSDNLFEARERIFKIRLLRGFGLFCRCWIHGCHGSLSPAISANASAIVRQSRFAENRTAD